MRSRIGRVHTLTCLLAFVAVGAGSLWGQANTASIYGSITDSSGAAVPNASVEGKNNLTGISSSTTTNAEGQFTLNALPIGTYTFSVHATGLQPQVRNSVTLSAGDKLELTFQLGVGNLQETVTVLEQTPILNTEQAEQHLTIDTQKVHELPLPRQDWTSLLQIGNGITKSGNGVSLNGLAPSGVNLTVDGTNASSDPEQVSLGFYQGFNIINTVNTEAIAEVSTTKGIAPASVAGSMSGNVNIITKGGSNQFHGSLLYLNNLSAYAARNQFLATKPRSTFNQFGFSLGGPIIHDKLFFFGDYQGVRLSSFMPINDTVPTPEFKRQVLAINPVYTSVLNLYPAPNQPYAPGAQTAQYFGAGALRQNDNNTVGRVDYYASSKDLITLRYTRARPFKNQPRVIQINPRVTFGHNDSYNAQYVHSSPTWTSVARFGYNRVWLYRLDAGLNISLDQITFGFDTIGAEGFEKRGGIYTYEDSISKTVGRHSLQFGGILQRWNSGRYDANTNTFGYANLSDFLANIPNQVVYNSVQSPFELHMYEIGGFIQDDFRVNSQLTLNLGLRYDYFTVPKERDNRIFSRVNGPYGPGSGPFGDPDNLYDSSWPNFAPRVGFAWNIKKTVIRGGSGLFFSPHPIFGGPIETVLNGGGDLPLRLTLNRAQALSLGLRYPSDSTAAAQSFLRNGGQVYGTAIEHHFPNPYSIQWNLGVEHDLGHNMVTEISYVGNRGLHLNMVRMINLPNRLTGVAPNPTAGSYRYYDGSDASWYNALQLSLQRRFANNFSYGVHYTWSNNMSYGDGDLLLSNPPQDNNNIRAQKGPTPYDIRHNFNANFLYELPFSKLTNTDARWAKMLLNGWQISGIFTALSGLPANITNSRSSYPLSRPDDVGMSPYFTNFSNTLQYLDPTAFAIVPIVSASGASIRPGNLGRNAIRQPGLWNLDASLAKNVALTERVRFQLRADLFNSFNHTNLGGLVTDVSRSTFGRLTTATSRSMQLGAKLSF